MDDTKPPSDPVVYWEYNGWHFAWHREQGTTHATHSGDSGSLYVGQYNAVETAWLCGKAWSSGYSCGAAAVAEDARRLAAQHPWKEGR